MKSRAGFRNCFRAINPNFSEEFGYSPLRRPRGRQRRSGRHGGRLQPQKRGEVVQLLAQNEGQRFRFVEACSQCQIVGTQGEKMEKKSAVEAIAGSTVTATALTVAPAALAAIGTGDPSQIMSALTNVVPSLAQSLAQGRLEQRVTKALQQVSEDLAELRKEVVAFDDDQHQFVSHSIVTMMTTINQEKLGYLRSAISNAASDGSTVRGRSEILARIIRDLSPAELAFLHANFGFQAIGISEEASTSSERLFFKPGSEEEMVFVGLLSMGLLYADAPTWDASLYRWSPMAGKILTLIRN